jgi:hypothetical protein
VFEELSQKYNIHVIEDRNEDILDDFIRTQSLTQ